LLVLQLLHLGAVLLLSLLDKLHLLLGLSRVSGELDSAGAELLEVGSEVGAGLCQLLREAFEEGHFGHYSLEEGC